MQETGFYYINSFFHNPVFLSAVFSWFIAQFIKTVIVVLYPMQKPIKYYLGVLLWKTGGMPSSHSALVTSIAISTGFQEGFNSTLFIAFSCFGLLVIRDSVGVRRAAGLQAIMLNRLGRELEKKNGIPFRPVKEVNGHTASEAIIGSIIGFFIAVAFNSL